MLFPVELMAEKKDQHWVAGHGSCSFLCDVGVSPPSDFSIESIIEFYFKYSIAGKNHFAKFLWLTLGRCCGPSCHACADMAKARRSTTRNFN